MMALVDRALTLNPNYARGWQVSGTLRVFAGQHDVAIEHAETSMRLSPRARVGTTPFTLALAHFYSRRFCEALPILLLAIQDDPSYPEPYRVLAACYAHMGRLDDAREVVTRLRAVTPVLIPNHNFLTRPDLELFLSGLRLAVARPGKPQIPTFRQNKSTRSLWPR